MHTKGGGLRAVRGPHRASLENASSGHDFTAAPGGPMLLIGLARQALSQKQSPASPNAGMYDNRGMSTTSLMTFVQFEHLPDAPGKRELIDGELIELPPLDFEHSRIAKRLYHRLLHQLPESRVWLEVGYRVAGGWLQPDVSVTWPDQLMLDRYLSGPPMLAIEAISPTNTASEIERKLTLYLSEGGAEVWVVDRKRQSMSVYRKAEGIVLRITTTAAYNSAQIGVTIELPQVLE